MAPDPHARGGSDRLTSLDLLRFLAAAAVVLFHFGYRYWTAGNAPIAALEPIARYGFLGVDVFFVLSGFVVLRSAEGRSPGKFVRGRILRLYPEFWLAVLLAAAVYHLAPGDFGGTPPLLRVLGNLTMIPTFIGVTEIDGVYWTLAVEVKFYFLLWALLLLRQMKHIDWWLVLAAAVSAATLRFDLPAVIRVLDLEPFGGHFAAGGILHLVFTRGWTPLRAAGLAIAVPALVGHAIGRSPEFLRPEDVTAGSQVVIAVVTLVTVALFVVLPWVRLGPRLAARATQAGALTYPLYLGHNTACALFLVSPFPAPMWVKFWLAVAAALGIAWGLMRLGTGPVQRGLRQVLDALPGLRDTRRAPAAVH